MSSDAFLDLLREVARAPEITESVDLVGARLGPFEVNERLGRGGMGVVYRARDERLDRDVAIKVVSPALAGTQGHARLREEARSAAQLNHPNIATVHEVAEHDGVELVAMELAPGGTLRGAHLEGRALEDALSDIARGLAHAHARGVVHRDLKPDNLARGEGGVVKILDFGLAARRPGEIAGTPAYMPPEQAEGHESGPRADVYAFGRTAVELACGRLPARGEEARCLEQARVPRRLRALFLRCLEDKPAARPLDGAELVRALRPPAPRGLVAGVGAAAVLLVLALAFPLSERRPPGPPSLTSLPAAEGGQRERARLQAAVESLYAADLRAAGRQLEVSSDETRALALAVAALERDAARFREARAGLAEASGWPGLLARATAEASVENLAGQAPLSGPVDEEVRAFLADREAGWLPRLLVAVLAPAAPADRAARLEALIAEDPGPALSWWVLANSWMRASEEARAREVVARARAMHPRNPVLRKTEAELLVDEDPERALVLLEEILSDEPADLSARFHRVEAWLALGQRERVALELARLIDPANGFEPRYAARGALAISRIYSARGEVRALLPVVERAVDGMVERQDWDALAAWLPRLWDEAQLRLDEEEARGWARLLAAHRARHPELEAVARMVEGEPPPAGPLGPEAERVAARLAYLADPEAEPRLKAARVPEVVALHVADAVPARRENILRGLARRADECAARGLWWAQLCRVAVARAAVELEDDEAFARVWPRADPEQPISRARVDARP